MALTEAKQKAFEDSGRFRKYSGPQRGAPRPRPQEHPREPQPAVERVGQHGDDKLRIMQMGGMEEIGRNMTIIEMGRDILIVDMGMEFPDEDQHGVDYIIPNITYLKGKEANIRGVLITHGHMDHIGAIPHLVGKLGNPTIYATKLTLGIIKKRQDDYRDMAPLKTVELKGDERLRLGHFEVEMFHESHNIPDSVGYIIHTPYGAIVHTGDFKFDLSSQGTQPADIAKIAALGAKQPLVLLSDSTSAEVPGYQTSESEVAIALEKILKHAKGRVIIGTFSSMLSRVQQLLVTAEKLGKKVAIEGYSLRSNVEIAKELGYIEAKRTTIVTTEQALRLPPDKVVIVCTGAMAQDRAVLMRIANQEHRLIKIQKGDTVVFSSSVIPGTEANVQSLKDTLARAGAEIVHYQMMDVHAGGHGKAEDLKLMLRLVNPRYFVPVHGLFTFRRTHGRLAIAVGLKPENVFLPDNGQVIEFSKAGGRVLNEKVPTDYVFVDGLGVGDTDAIVLRDRQLMAKGGMVIAIVTVRKQTGELIGKPDLIAKGFIQLEINRKLERELEEKVHQIAKKHPHQSTNEAYLKDKLRNDLGQFIFTKTQRRPMILPVVVEV